MQHNVSHFHFDADDLARARRFYETVFGWRFRPWGPPDYFMIATGDDARPGIHGSLGRRERPLRRDAEPGFELTIQVADVDATIKAIESQGGTIVMQRSVIHGVGEHARFRDTEGNVMAIMRYFDESQCG
jgi:predicted enzyme related to lactoylglutathione lyase